METDRETNAANAATLNAGDTAGANATPDALVGLDALAAETARVEPEVEDVEDADEIAETEDGRFDVAAHFVGIPCATLGELLDNPPPPPDPIVCDLFERGNQVHGIGKAKSKKTWFFLGLALHVAAGRDYCGFGIPRPRRVVYVNMELPIDWTKRRAATCKNYGIDPDEIADRFEVVNGRGYEAEVWKGLASWPAGTDVDLIVVDPLSNILGDADECSATDMRQVCGLFSKICNRGPAVLVVHHDGKGVPGLKSDLDRGCGSSVLARVADARIVLTPHQDEPDDMIVASTISRNFEQRPPKSLAFDAPSCTFRNVDLPAIAAGSPRNAAHTMTKVENAIRNVLARHEGITKKDLVFKVRMATGLEERTIQKGLSTLAEQGEIEGRPEDPDRNNSIKRWYPCTGASSTPGGAAHA